MRSLDLDEIFGFGNLIAHVVVAPDQKRVLIKAGRDLAVRPTETFIAEIGRLIGEGRVQLIPRKPQSNGNGRARGRPWPRCSAPGTARRTPA